MNNLWPHSRFICYHSISHRENEYDFYFPLSADACYYYLYLEIPINYSLTRIQPGTVKI